MHLWPTQRLRDSFKLSYLKKLEWNYRRMEQQQQQQQQQQKLLDEVDADAAADNNTLVNLKSEAGSVASFCQDLLLVLSCCYCCFCCGACAEEK